MHDILKLMKNDISLSLGSEILYQSEPHIIKAYLSLTSLLLSHKITGTEVVTELSTIISIGNETTSTLLVEHGIAQLPDKLWQEAERRATLIRPLAEMSIIPAILAQDIARKLSIWDSKQSPHQCSQGVLRPTNVLLYCHNKTSLVIKNSRISYTSHH